MKKNKELFIKNKQLKKFALIRDHIDYLPIHVYYGTIFLIKGKTIFEISTCPIYEPIVDPIRNHRSLFYDKQYKHKTTGNHFVRVSK